MWFKVLLGAVLFLNLFGCATAKKDIAGLQLQQLESRVTELETELQQKNEEINYLEAQLESTQSPKSLSIKKGAAGDSRSAASGMSFRNIQLALKKAGFYNGPVDGKIGKETKKAIKAFQKANGLTADALVGEQTSLKLKKFLK